MREGEEREMREGGENLGGIGRERDGVEEGSEMKEGGIERREARRGREGGRGRERERERGEEREVRRVRYRCACTLGL